MLNVTGHAFAAPPSSVSASYDIYKGELRIGKIEETYTRDNDHYSLVSITKAVGIVAIFKRGRIIIKSNGLITPQGLQPVKFTDQREGEEDRNRQAEFDWKALKLTLTSRGKSNEQPLPSGTQDRLSAMYQFMFLSLADKDKLSFNMTNGDKLDIYNYTISHDQSVTVPLGKFKAMYVASVPEADASKTEIWLAEDHDNFPYKMVITDSDGDKLSQELTKLTFVP